MLFRNLSAIPDPISAIGFGTWALGGEAFAGHAPSLTPEQERESVLLVHRALEGGISFFDTADSYGLGNAERVLGRALAQRPDAPAVISTKFGGRQKTGAGAGVDTHDFSPEWMRQAVEGSLQRLGRARVELLLFHNPPDDFDWASYPREPLEALRHEGKLGAYGVSCKTFRGAERVLEARFGHAIEVVYNILDRRIEERVLPMAKAQGVGVIARVPLASGFLSGTLAKQPFGANDVRSTLSEAEVAWRFAQVEKLRFLDDEPGGMPLSALRFCLSNPDVTTVAPGMRTQADVEANLRAEASQPLSPTLLERIRKAVPELAFPGAH
jgi:aryl-alcohol dehydrogenase-like predicted oxidoreductase